MHRHDHHLRRARAAFALAILCGGALACGEDVLVGRWVLRAGATDAGLGPDAGAADNPQSFNAERARDFARARELDKDDGHAGNRPGDKRH